MTAPKKSSLRRGTLQQQGLVNPSAGLVQDELFQEGDFFDPADIVQARYEMLRSIRQGERTAVAAASAFGVSRATLYQARGAFEREGIVGLIPRKRGPRGAHKLTDEVVAFAKEEIGRDPNLSSADLARLIGKQFGISVHPRSVERALDYRKKKRQQGK